MIGPIRPRTNFHRIYSYTAPLPGSGVGARGTALQETGGRAPLAQTHHIGALRSGLAIGEAQALLNPHVGSDERGVSPPHPGSGPWWESPRGVGTGHDELLVRTGRALADCPSTMIKTVFRGDGLLIADRPIVPENDVRLLNWTVSSRVSIPNVSANWGGPPPRQPLSQM